MKRDIILIFVGGLSALFLLAVGYFSTAAYKEYSQYREWKELNSIRNDSLDSMVVLKKNAEDSAILMDMRRKHIEDSLDKLVIKKREEKSDTISRTPHVISDIPSYPVAKNDLVVSEYYYSTPLFACNKHVFTIQNNSANNYDNVIVRMYFHMSGKIKSFDYNLRGDMKAFSKNTFKVCGDSPSKEYSIEII